MGTYSDEELIAEHLKGNEDAFPALLERHISSVYNFVVRLSGRDEAEDIVQETFFKVWRNMPSFSHTHASFRTWLMTITRNTTVDFLRKRRPAVFSEFVIDETNSFEESLTDETPLPDEIFKNAETVQMLEEALTHLSAGAREVILLRYRQELSFREIGEILRQSENTVKSRHRRALVALQEVLKKNRNGK